MMAASNATPSTWSAVRSTSAAWSPSLPARDAWRRESSATLPFELKANRVESQYLHSEQFLRGLVCTSAIW